MEIKTTKGIFRQQSLELFHKQKKKKKQIHKLLSRVPPPISKEQNLEHGESSSAAPPKNTETQKTPWSTPPAKIQRGNFTPTI